MDWDRIQASWKQLKKRKSSFIGDGCAMATATALI